MMKLYFSPGACSLAVHIVLNESGLPFVLERVDLSSHRTAGGGDYRAINPKGQVPLLELEDGQCLSEGPVIAQYVADLAGATRLMPPSGSLARYRVMEWQNFITSELHKSFTPLFNRELEASAKHILAGLLRRKFEWVDSRLATSPFLAGEHFSAADAYLFTVCRWAPLVALDLSGLPDLQRFLQEVGARPAVRRAMQSEGLVASA